MAIMDKASKTVLYQGKSSEEGLFLFKSPPVSSISQPYPSAFVSSASSLPKARCTDSYFLILKQKLLYPLRRMPSKSLNMSSPYELLFHEPPDITQLKIFGSSCYPYLRPYAYDKLDPRTTQYVFLGYALGYKGVFCYSISQNKLWMSRHVIHDESVFPFHNSKFSVSSPIDSAIFFPSCTPLTTLYSSRMPVQSSSVHNTCATIHGISSAVNISSLGATTNSVENPFVHTHNDENAHNVGNAASVDITQSDFNIKHASTGVDMSVENPFDFNIEHASTGVDMSVANPSVGNSDMIVENAVAGTDNGSNGAHCTNGGNMLVENAVAGTENGLNGAHCTNGGNMLVENACTGLVQNNLSALSESELNALQFGTRLVAQGFSQSKGLDYDETFSPVVRHSTVRVILALAAMNNWELRQLDVKNAFLHGDLKEEVYMFQPQGFVDSEHPNYVCLLRKSLYGLKQAPRAWNEKFTNFLPRSDTTCIHEVISELSMVFDMKDLGSLSYFLGLEVTKVRKGILLSQTKYAKDLLAKAGMESINTCSSPCLPHAQMTADQDVHYAAVKRILRYLKGTIQKGIFYSSTGVLSNAVTVKAFCDADWAGEVIQKRSTTGFIVYLGLCPVSWQSKKQGTVSRSSTESEYRSLANTAAEISWIRHLLCDLKIQIPCAPLLKCDNLSALALASNPVFHSKIKHLGNDFHFVRERVQRNDLRLEYVSTTEQTADILLKGLASPIFKTHCINLRLVSLAELEGGC
uniref:uncharacterized protein LOC101305369 n=1 Tax=Fragaria vesca subsp. vesca TaxID=101020 RepID=UPI0005C9C1C5|nr:PREDICTED: uncharacterized protein LOC101305369 [Fragaria vesca subsp. vesca]